jgi:hypothetical protein
VVPRPELPGPTSDTVVPASEPVVPAPLEGPGPSVGAVVSVGSVGGGSVVLVVELVEVVGGSVVLVGGAVVGGTVLGGWRRRALVVGGA